ncbi:hypothetical protein Lal_00043196 [Lupinus albus]|nr:hypothetical protein Lal_00043196 [Lupinus albus]
MVSHILKIDPTYLKQVREEKEELGTREQSSGSRSSELILAQARKSRLFKISDLTLSLKRWILTQARISQCQQPQNTISRPGENPPVYPRISPSQRLVDDRRYQQLKANFKATQRSVSLSFNVEIVRE